MRKLIYHWGNIWIWTYLNQREWRSLISFDPFINGDEDMMGNWKLEITQLLIITKKCQHPKNIKQLLSRLNLNSQIYFHIFPSFSIMFQTYFQTYFHTFPYISIYIFTWNDTCLLGQLPPRPWLAWLAGRPVAFARSYQVMGVPPAGWSQPPYSLRSITSH